MNSFTDQLQEWCKENNVDFKPKEKVVRKVKKGNEVLSKWDLEELMGSNRPTYSRRRGAIRQR